MNKNINLQLFAEEPEVTPEPKDNTEAPIDKSYTEAELQAEADRRVSKALETSKAKWQSEQSTLVEEKVREAERLAKLSEEEKNKELESLRVKDLDEREQELNTKILELEAVKQLSSKGLPTNFSSLVMGSTAEIVIENINNVEELFKQEIQKAVDERLKGSTPKTGSAPASGMTKEEFNTLSYNKRAAIFETDKELYDKLSK